MTCQPQLKMPPHVRPFSSEDTVYHRVAHGPVPARPMMADHAVLLGTQSLDRPLRGEVEVVRAQADHPAPERVERVLEQQQLAAGVDVAALPALSVPRVADLDAIYFRHDVVIARAPNDGAARQLPYRPRQYVAFLLSRQSAGNVRVRLLWFGYPRERELPEPAVGCGSDYCVVMLPRQRLQPNAVALECNGVKLEHVSPPASSPSRLRRRL